MNIKVYLMPFFLFVFSFLLSGQGEIEDEQKIIFRNENTFSASIATNGFALNYRYGKHINAYRKFIYDFDLAYIKHSKENRGPTPGSQRGFVYGKLNHFFAAGRGWLT
ncbi:MAG: hypothetical protein HC896_04380 [Bacteroidales bacterium]|nr:hypothetical protein [Bacteroidales bacterium]